MEVFSSLVDAVNNILWSYVLIIVLVGCGIWFTLSTKFVQLRMLPEMLRVLTEGIGSKGSGKEAISSFQAFCVSTASRVGVGNIAGVAIAIVTGGPARSRRSTSCRVAMASSTAARRTTSRTPCISRASQNSSPC